MNAFTFVKIEGLAVFSYNIFLYLYRLAISISSLWNIKAKKWTKGRKDIFEKIRTEIGEVTSNIVWVHCSSLGEFEQGRPVIETIKAQGTNNKIVLTFFSPSGYEIKKNYSGADHIFYLPMDSKKNAKKFLDLLKPRLAIFIKYDYWYYYLTEIKKRKINCLLVSAVFRKHQPFFKWYGSLHRKMLACFTLIFVQNEESKQLLETIHIDHCTVSGDTRFDTVIEIARKFKSLEVIENFVGNRKCIVAGSTWRKDEEILKNVFDQLSAYDLALIIAPHEINNAHLDELKKLFPKAIRFSELTTQHLPSANRVLIIDSIGILSRLYHYAYITYVGGGFTKDGVHNVLEAAVYGKPVLFGNNYKKYKEAIDLIKYGGAKTFSNANELYEIMITLLKSESKYNSTSEASKKFVWKNNGAAEKVLSYIEMNRLLTR
jgi:3-deoxy-D-manno-octulosonic-acid transferase